MYFWRQTFPKTREMCQIYVKSCFQRWLQTICRCIFCLKCYFQICKRKWKRNIYYQCLLGQIREKLVQSYICRISLSFCSMGKRISQQAHIQNFSVTVSQTLTFFHRKLSCWCYRLIFLIAKHFMLQASDGANSIIDFVFEQFSSSIIFWSMSSMEIFLCCFCLDFFIENAASNSFFFGSIESFP